jgi:hypothetical protein
VQIMTNIAENNKVVDAMLMEKYFVYKTALWFVYEVNLLCAFRILSIVAPIAP